MYHVQPPVIQWSGSDSPGGYDREMGSRPGYGEEQPASHIGRSGGYLGWDSRRGSHGDATIIGEGLMSYKQFIQELEDDILPEEAERRYQEYKSEYISTLKKAFFDAHKEEEWLKDKYHPTNLVAVIERRNELVRKIAKDFLLDLKSGTLHLSPCLNANNLARGNPNSQDEVDGGGKRRRRGRGPDNESELLSTAPKAHPVSSETRRVHIDIEQAQALARQLDLEKGIGENILCGSDSYRTRREKPPVSSAREVIIVRGLKYFKGLVGVELLDTLLTYLWRVHCVDYYGMRELAEAKGLRHVRASIKGSDVINNGAEWENKVDSWWQNRLKDQDPLGRMAAKERIDAAAVEAMESSIRKIRDEKYGWKYGCGARACTKLFHAEEFVHKHLKFKHPDLITELTSKAREDLYFQNYMNDPDAPGGAPVGRKLPNNHFKEERRDCRDNGKYDRSENPQLNDVPNGAKNDDKMLDAFGGQGIPVALALDMVPPPVLMPVPGAGPLGPFVPAPPEVAMQMLGECGRPSFGSGNKRRPGPALAPFLLPPGFQRDPRHIRSYQDLDSAEDEVTVIDYRSL